MSEPLGPNGGDGFGGPASRPSGDGLPPKTGGLKPGNVQGEDARDPGMQGEGDLGEDSGGPKPGGMIGEG